MTISPYAAALGSRMGELHPTLQRYFSTIPAGHVGVGSGTFAFAGTRLAWLRPLLRLLQPAGVLYAATLEHVDFTVRNTPANGTVSAVRTLQVPGGVWAMRDRVSAASAGHVVDTLGSPARVAAVFRVDVVDGALILNSTRVGVRWGRLKVRIPQWMAPRVRLTERFDDEVGRQHVSVIMTMPLLGEIYGYHGHFDYGVHLEGDE